MCMAVIPRDIFTEGLMKLVELDKAWVPAQKAGMLYTCACLFASEARFGVKISDEYKFHHLQALFLHYM